MEAITTPIRVAVVVATLRRLASSAMAATDLMLRLGVVKSQTPLNTAVAAVGEIQSAAVSQAAQAAAVVLERQVQRTQVAAVAVMPQAAQASFS